MTGFEKIPITVGVVGHLDAITTPDHKLQIEILFKDLATKYPNSPVYLFSSVAEGADRFVANLFLALKRNNEDYKERFELIIPLPFEDEEYKTDFDDDSDEEFELLLKQAKWKFCTACDGKRIDRAQHYLETGKFVADSSLILIALWDGQEGKKGGTADIVRYKKKGDETDVAKSTFEYEGSVFVLPCNRNTSVDQISFHTQDSRLSLETVLKDSTIREALERIEEINSDSLKISQEKHIRSQSLLISGQENINAPQKSILNSYSLLDLLAVMVICPLYINSALPRHKFGFAFFTGQNLGSGQRGVRRFAVHLRHGGFLGFGAAGSRASRGWRCHFPFRTRPAEDFKLPDLCDRAPGGGSQRHLRPAGNFRSGPDFA